MLKDSSYFKGLNKNNYKSPYSSISQTLKTFKIIWFKLLFTGCFDIYGPFVVGRIHSINKNGPSYWQIKEQTFIFDKCWICLNVIIHPLNHYLSPRTKRILLQTSQRNENYITIIYLSKFLKSKCSIFWPFFVQLLHQIYFLSRKAAALAGLSNI